MAREFALRITDASDLTHLHCAKRNRRDTGGLKIAKKLSLSVVCLREFLKCCENIFLYSNIISALGIADQDRKIRPCTVDDLLLLLACTFQDLDLVLQALNIRRSYRCVSLHGRTAFT